MLQDTIELIRERHANAELGFLSGVIKNPVLMEEYSSVSVDMFHSKEGKMLWEILSEAGTMGVSRLDRPILRKIIDGLDYQKEFEEFGSFDNFEKMERVGTKNVEPLYDELVDMNLKIKLAETSHETMANIIKGEMTADEIYNLQEYKNSDFMLSAVTTHKVESLKITREFIDRCKAGENIGVPYRSKILSGTTLGLAMGGLHGFGAYSGTGKTTWVMDNLITFWAERKIKTCVISNEMKADAFKNMYLPNYLARKKEYYGLSRKKFRKGDISEEADKMIDENLDALNDMIDDVAFIKLFSYSITEVEKIIKKYVRLGYTTFIYDTFKADNSASGNVVGETVEASKRLFHLADKYGVCIVFTVQLASHTKTTRYLTEGCLSQAKQIKEVVDTLFLMRDVFSDEFSGERADIKPYNLSRDSGKWEEKPYEYFTEDKDWRLIFINKSRSSEDGVVVLDRFKGAFGIFEDVAFAHVKNTGV